VPRLALMPSIQRKRRSSFQRPRLALTCVIRA
jgi:hypothetical protein